MFIEKYNSTKWKIIGCRVPVIGEYILHYDIKFTKIIDQVDRKMEQKAFILERINN
jgi:hypothetical protein